MNPPAPSTDAADRRGSGPDAPRTIVFRRGRHRWVFSCTDEDRGLLLLDLLEMADDPRVPLGSLDVDLIARSLRDPPRPSADLDATPQPTLAASWPHGSQA